MIPKIFHMICISPMVLEFRHFLSVISIYHYVKPEIIYLYADIEQSDNKYWNILKNYVKVIIITPPKFWRGKEIKHPQYQADIIRLEKLLEMGGIYIDIDNYIINSIDHLLDNDLVMTVVTKDDINNINWNDVDSMSNSIIFAKPNNLFLKTWYDQMHNFMYDKYPWSYHAVCLPRDIMKNNTEYRNKVTFLNWDKTFAVMGWWYKVLPVLDEIDNSYCMDGKLGIIFYQTIQSDLLNNYINEGKIREQKNVFSKIMYPLLSYIVE